MPTSSPVDHYQVLGLTRQATSAEVKTAYHQKLLQHHPDKNKSAESAASTQYPVDDIRLAFQVLSDPARRASYDRAATLQARQLSSGAHGSENAARWTGIDAVDLEDLTYDATQDAWRRSCHRCGDENGFLVQSGDLERESEHGEIVLSCASCSLHIRLLFAVEPESCDTIQVANC